MVVSPAGRRRIMMLAPDGGLASCLPARFYTVFTFGTSTLNPVFLACPMARA
jgi:hypothetical protein